MAKFNKTAVILLAIILAGLSIRIYDLGKESLWKDEAAVLYTAEKGSIAEVAESAIEMHRGHPPLNFVLLHFWGKTLWVPPISTLIFTKRMVSS